MRACVTVNGVEGVFDALAEWADGGFTVRYGVPEKSGVGRQLTKVWKTRSQIVTYTLALRDRDHLIVGPTLVDLLVADRPYGGGDYLFVQPVHLTSDRPAVVGRES